MSTSYHPTDETLLRFAAATLGEAASIVVNVHLAVCASCRAQVETFEVAGGAMLDAIEPTTLRPDAFAKVLARIDSSRQTPAGSGPTSGIIDPGVPVPDALRGYKIGPWTFAGPGLKMSKIATNPSDRSKLFLLKAAPGASLSQHGHGGEELICVLKGSFRDDAGTYRPGDVASADASIEHRPQVSDDGDCICLVALEGGLRLRSVIGRILQPVLGF